MATRSTSTRGLRKDDDAPDRRERKHVQAKKKHPAESKAGKSKAGKAKAATSPRAKKGTQKPKTGGTKGPSALPRYPPGR
jgi:hypothetical protein